MIPSGQKVDAWVGEELSFSKKLELCNERHSNLLRTPKSADSLHKNKNSPLPEPEREDPQAETCFFIQR